MLKTEDWQPGVKVVYVKNANYKPRRRSRPRALPAAR